MEAQGQLEVVPDKLVETEEAHWMDTYDWDNLGLVWKEGGATLNTHPVVVNPINAMFGRIQNMQNCIFNITIGSLETRGGSSNTDR